MGRKSVPFVDESSLLRLRLRDALDDDLEASLIEDEGEDSDDGVMAAPAGLTLEDLYRRNRNRARLIGLLHTHRTYQGAQIVVVAGGAPVMEQDDVPDCDDDAMRWFVKPIERERLVHAALRLVH